ncbi:MAG: ChbG/HpnK family deacetylase [Eubacteriales bacterium]|nr:ChbG/HpnK family deacetylase [Eubacteriales bacterium]
MKLIVRCDDFGYTNVFNYGLKDALECNVVTHVEIMPDTPGAIDAMQTIRQYPWISTAWHVHWWGRPSADPAKIPSLLDEEGKFKFRRDMWDCPEHSAMLDVDEDEAYLEMQAQMEKYIKYLGKTPDISSYVGISEGPLAKAADRICKDYEILPNRECRKMKMAHGNWCPIHTGPRYSEDSRIRNNEYDPLGYLLRDPDGLLQEDIAMCVFHPGYIDTYMYEDFMFWYKYDRTYFDGCMLVDALALTSPKLQKWIKENRVELINYMDAVRGSDYFQEHLKEIGSKLYMREEIA